MEAFSQKYTIVQLLEKTEVGAEFTSDNWPLHSTVVDTFAIDWSVNEMVSKMTEVLSGYGMITSEAKDDRLLGDGGKTLVVLLKPTDELLRLHHDLLAVLSRGGLVLNDPQFAGDGFLPHSTVQKHKRLYKGDTVNFVALSVIDMFPDSNPYKRKILATVPL